MSDDSPRSWPGDPSNESPGAEWSPPAGESHSPYSPPPSWGGFHGWSGGAPPGGHYPPGANVLSAQPKSRRRGASLALTALLTVIGVLAGIAIGTSIQPSINYPASKQSGPSTSPGGSSTPGGSSSNSQVTAIAKKVDPALVDIRTVLGYAHMVAAGTGIVLNSDGLILTNNHVINGSTSIQVTDIGNQRTYVGHVVGYDETDDVALVQLVGASHLATADLGDSSGASTGQSVVAIGNAGGIGGTPSAVAGRITALNQSITAKDDADGTSEHLHGLIQTNAAIRPGDSGGPLVYSSGQVVGMDTAASDNFQFGGTQGFSIPINFAMDLAHQIRSGSGSAAVHVGATAFLGVAFTQSELAGSRAVVGAVITGTAAAKAGLAAGDTLTSLGGHKIGAPGGLTSLLIQYHPGDSVELTWSSNSGARGSAKVVLGAGPNA